MLFATLCLRWCDDGLGVGVIFAPGKCDTRKIQFSYRPELHTCPIDIKLGIADRAKHNEHFVLGLETCVSSDLAATRTSN